MKLLSIKKCLIGFIVVTTSIFLYSTNVEAYEIKYNDVSFDLEEIMLQIENDLDKDIDYENTYKYHTVYVNNFGHLIFAFTNGGTFNKIDSNLEDSTDYVRNDNYYLNLVLGSQGLGLGSGGFGYAYNFTNSKGYSNQVTASSNSVYSAASSGTSSSRFTIFTSAEYENFTTNEDYRQALEEKILYSNVNISPNDVDVIRKYDTLAFDKTYFVADYSKVEIEIDISNEPLISTGILIDTTLVVQHAGRSENSSGFPFSKPYIEHTYKLFDSGDPNIYTEIYYNDGESGSLGDFYYIPMSGYMNVALEPNDKLITKIKFVIPIDADLGHIRVQFDSNLSYTVTEYEKTDFTFTELDLTGKYGALLVAKIHDNDFSANFKVNGAFLLETRDTYDTENFKTETYATYGFCDALLEKQENYNCSYVNRFSYMFYKDSPYKVLAVTNINYNNDRQALFYYDSSLFDLYVLDKKDSVIVIKDPVTGEDYFYDNTDAVTNSQNTVDVEYLAKILEEYWAENDNIVSFIKTIFSSFFNEMPDYIYKSLVVVMFIMFMCVVIAIMGWK